MCARQASPTLARRWHVGQFAILKRKRDNYHELELPRLCSFFVASFLVPLHGQPVVFLFFKMLFLSAARSLLAAAMAFQAVVAHNIVLPARGVECFHESLRKDDKMTVTFQVGDREFGSAGNLDIDFWV